MKTLIHGGDVVAYADGGHRLLRNGALVFDDDRVTFVGRTFSGPVDQRIDAAGQLVIPGLVNIHCHADTEAGGRLIADAGRRDYFHTGFLNYYGARKGAKSLGPRQDPEIGGRFAMAEMLRNGCTTVVDIGVAAEIHAGQNLLEFHEILRRHTMTPVEYLADTGLLGPDAIVGHCIISTAHHLAALPAGRDLEILARTGASVAHCPLVFARRGNALESFAKYRRAGINVGLGTDTYPRDLISEMRWASNLCKIVERDFTVATAADVFSAVTL